MPAAPPMLRDASLSTRDILPRIISPDVYKVMLTRVQLTRHCLPPPFAVFERHLRPVTALRQSTMLLPPADNSSTRTCRHRLRVARQTAR